MPTKYLTTNSVAYNGYSTYDYSGDQFTHIAADSANTNHSNESYPEVSKFWSGGHTGALIKFPGLSNITAPVTVSQVKFGIYQVGTSGHPPTRTMSMYRLLRDWVLAQVTWNIYSTGNNWQTAGGLGANDRSGTVSGTSTMPAGWLEIVDNAGQLCTDVQNFINGVNSNYGWMLERTDGADDSTYDNFANNLAADSTRPYLIVTYTAGGGGGATSGTNFFRTDVQLVGAYR